MSNAIDCFWYPELAKCQTADDSGSGGSGGSGDSTGGDGSKMESSDAMVALPLVPLMGQVVYLLAALGKTIATVHQLFRWHGDTAAGADYYAAWTT